MSTTGEKDNQQSIAENQNTEDTTIESTDYPFRNGRMWQSAYLLEVNDRIQFVPRNGRSLRNEFRMSAGPADFLSVSQLCATRASDDLNENVDVTSESQFRKVDDAVNQLHESNMENQQTDNSVGMNENLVDDVSNVNARSDAMVTDGYQSIENANVGRNSLKRRSSVVETIISEWSTPSPVKIQKSQNVAVQLSPKFKFNRQRCKTNYLRKHNSDECGKLVKTCPSTVGKSVDSHQTSKYSANDNGFDGIDLNGGLVPITLPEFFLKCDRKLSALPSITLPDSFYEFDTDSEVDCSPACSPVHSSEQLLLMDDEDDDLFADYQTQQYVSKEEVGIEQPETITSTAAAAANDGWTHNTTMFNIPRCSQFGITSNDPSHAELCTSGSYASFSSVRPQEIDHNRKVDFPGFSSVSGKQIPVSLDAVSKKPSRMRTNNIFEDIDREFGITSNDPSHAELCTSGSYASFSSVRPQEIDHNRKVDFPGFSSVSGKQIPVSLDAVSKRMRIFESATVSEDDLKKTGNWIGDNNHETDKGNSSSVLKFNPTAFNGFTTARGNHIPVASQSILKKTNIFHNVNITEDEIKEIPTPSTIDSSNIVRNVNHFNSNPSFMGFSTGAGKHMPLPSKRITIFDDLNVGDDELANMNHWISDVEHSNNTENAGSTDGTRKVRISNSLFTNSTHNVEDNVAAKATLSIDGGMSNTTSTATSTRSTLCVTPTNNQNSYTQMVRECTAAFMDDEEMTFANQNVQLKEQTPGFASGFMAELTASSTPINKTENRLKQRRLVEKFDDIAREDYAESNATSPEIIKVNISPKIKSLRVAAIAEQRLSTTKKINVKAVPSSLYVNKLTSTQVSWKEYVEHSRPVNTHTSLIVNVTTDNATKFKFNGWDHYSDKFCQENVDGIRLHDDIVVMMDGNCQIGLTEISTAFQCCPSVDVKLIHDKWIENHMKWIVVKLAAMERSFPQRFAGKVLTLENLMLQLKYRYEREIDRAERSAIRKICEMDDVPEKRMILYVAGITKNGSEYEVQLSDGWYSLPSTLDFGMRRLVDEGRIKIGTKLVIYGASTVNLSAGCHPLDVSANVKLKIHANSTRRARWDSKLGYCKHPGPFNISLKSVWDNGGNITKLRICVLRVYPVVYVDPKNLSDVHSEMVERRRSINEEREKSRIFDSIISEVTRDFEEEEMSNRYNDRPRKITKLGELSSIADPAYLCELLDNDKDPERIESELSSTQKSMVLDYKAKLNYLRNEQINTRVKAKLAAVDKGYRKFVPLLRFKATDETFYDKTAVVTVWKPTEEILSLIREESVFDLTGSSSRGTNLSELQIYAGKSAKFEKISVATRVPTSLLRRHISISEILSIEHVEMNELDTTGVVVHVGERFQGLQPVFIADSSHNIVRINFWLSVKEFAYEDILQPKRFLAIKNLQWRKSSNSKPIPTAYATEHTQFMENPQSTELSSALISLKEQFANVDLNEFIEICMGKMISFNASSCLSNLS